MPKTREPSDLHDKAASKNPEATVALDELFHQLCLPLPNTDQCLRRHHGDFLIPISSAGVTVHLSKHGQPLPAIVRHPHILQPLGEINHGGWHARIMPGTSLVPSDQDYDTLCNTLTKDHISFHDRNIGNIGMLPITTPEFPNGVPVVIDANAAKALPQFDPTTHTDGLQTKLYQPLREQLAHACADKQTMHKEMRNFWRACTAAKEADTLVAGWQTLNKHSGADQKSHSVREIATDYGTDLSRYWRSIDKQEMGIRSTPSSLLRP